MLDIKTFFAFIRMHSHSLPLSIKSHFQRKRISFNSLTLKSILYMLYRLLFEMAVSFRLAMRLVLYASTHTNAIQIQAQAYSTQMVSVLIRIFPISIGVVVLANQNYFDSRGNFIQTHYSGLMFHLLLRWNDGTHWWTLYGCEPMCVCMCGQSSLSKRR